jgi:hypothetical protein
LSPGIRPENVKGAAISNLNEQKASWTKAGFCGSPQQKLHLTTILCHVPEKAPLSRIAIHVPSEQVNFRRRVSVEDAKGVQIASGEVSRVRVNRAGLLVTSEDLSVNASGASGAITINIDNGDNPPLAIAAAEPLALEQRVYFDPQGKTTLRLYYGDEKLAVPDYDYARFFHLEASPAKAQLGSGAHNDRYTGRPDDRPWSDRHTGVLWTAMLAAVVSLAALALRGFRGEKTS